jgi:hypothetical protein
LFLFTLGDKFFSPDDDGYNWIPINAFDAFNEYFGGNRIQMPFRLAYALTIHKSQGQTLSKVSIYYFFIGE